MVDSHLDMEYHYMVHGSGGLWMPGTNMRVRFWPPEAGHGREQRLVGPWTDLNFERGCPPVAKEDQEPVETTKSNPPWTFLEQIGVLAQGVGLATKGNSWAIIIEPL